MSDGLSTYVPDSLSKNGQEIAAQLLRGLDDLAKKTARLGALLVEMSDEDRTLFIHGFPGHYQRIWNDLLRVGRGEMHPRLVTASGRASQVLRKLPYAEQEQFIVELIPVVTGADKRAVKHFDIETLPADLTAQVFAQGGGNARVRSVEEQRQWRSQNAARKEAQEQKAQTTEITRPGLWAIRHGRAHLSKALVERGLSLDDIEKIRSDLKL